MKNRAYFFVLLLLAPALSNCKKSNTDPAPITTASQTALLVSNTWVIKQISDVNGKAYTDGQLSLTTLAVKSLDFQFKSDNTVRASDSITKQIKNGGTWYLVDTNTALDVNVTGFSGKFPVVELTKTKLTLRQVDKINGVANTPINLEFVPSI